MCVCVCACVRVQQLNPLKLYTQWSYGVTMWEIFSGGKGPFPGTDPLTLMQRLEEGERMPKPYNAACTDEM